MDKDKKKKKLYLYVPEDLLRARLPPVYCKRTCLELGARSCVRLRGDGGALMWMKFEVKVKL